jgi:hypothetical protein
MAKFTWTVRLSVDKTWVEDGFDLTDERAKDMLRNELPQAYDFEVAAKVIKAPDPEKIAKVQGYKSAQEMMAAR